MATNTFNNALAANVGTADVIVYTNPVTVGVKSIVLQLDVANRTAGGRTVTAWIDRGGTAYHLCVNAPLPVGSTLQVVYGQKVVLQTTTGPIRDKIVVKCDTTNGVDVVCSILEDV
jgi:hypothetical protein